MKPSTHQSLKVAVLCLLSATAVARADLDERQTLVFAWPNGLVADVSWEASSASGQSNANSSSTHGRYTMSAKAVDGGLEIEFSDYALDFGEGLIALDDDKDSRLMLYGAVSREPGLVVDGRGALLRLEGMEAIRRGIRRPVEQMMAGLPEAARLLVAQMYDPAVEARKIEARARQRWARLVGLWSGVGLGSAWRDAPDDELTLQALSELQVPVKRRYRLLGTQSCGKATSGSECVQLELHTTLDEVRLPAAIEACKIRAPAVEVIAVELEEWVRLTTEPTSLRPHRIEVERQVKVDAKRPRREIHTLRVDQRTTTYHYR